MPGNDSRPASERNPEIFTYVSRLIETRLSDQPAWPANLFKLECESYGVYQDFTGSVLKELLGHEAIGKIRVTYQRDKNRNENDENPGYPYFTRPGEPGPTQEVRDDMYAFIEFLRDNWAFGELAAYVTLCKVGSELQDHISGIHTVPKGPYPTLLQGPANELDALVILADEMAPVEIYNGMDYLGDEGDKADQVRAYSSGNNPTSNPVVINRRSDREFKKLVRRNDGMTIDTDFILGCEDNHSDLPPVLDRLNLDDIVHLIPPLKTRSGELIDGSDYEDPKTVRNNAELLSPSNVIPAVKALPPTYVDRIRGGIQLLYVNSFYRQASDRTSEYASLVAQNAYNRLLREDKGQDKRGLLKISWESTTRHYSSINSGSQQESLVLERASDLLTDLSEGQTNVVFERDGKISARRSEHPQQSFDFTPHWGLIET